MLYNPNTFKLVLLSFFNRTNLVYISGFPQCLLNFGHKTDDENYHQL